MIAPAIPIGLRHFANLPAFRVGAYTHASRPTSLDALGSEDRSFVVSEVAHSWEILGSSTP